MTDSSLLAGTSCGTPDVLLVSNRFESSSKTDLRDKSRCTIGDGWVGLRSRENLFRPPPGPVAELLLLELFGTVGLVKDEGRV